MIPEEERSRLPVAFLVGIGIVTIVIAVLYSKYAAPFPEDDRPLIIAGRASLRPANSFPRRNEPRVNFLNQK